nr:toprim domain, Twinkle-like protein [Tanacetum cinerariifolium]
MISAETLQKNAMMQMIDDKNVIAFTYRRNGELVNCNFYSITSKNFWQAKNGERILYGLDGIEEGNDIVIVITLTKLIAFVIAISMSICACNGSSL